MTEESQTTDLAYYCQPYHTGQATYKGQNKSCSHYHPAPDLEMKIIISFQNIYSLFNYLNLIIYNLSTAWFLALKFGISKDRNISAI